MKENAGILHPKLGLD